MRTETTRLVVVAEGDGLVARVYGMRGHKVTMIHEKPVVGFDRALNVANNRHYPHGWTLHLGEEDITVADGGCGCGSPLKNYNPGGDLRMSAVVAWPTEPINA